MGVGFTCVKHMIPWFHGKSRAGKEQSQVEGNRFHEIEKPGEGGLDVDNFGTFGSSSSQQNVSVGPSYQG